MKENITATLRPTDPQADNTAASLSSCLCVITRSSKIYTNLLLRPTYLISTFFHDQNVIIDNVSVKYCNLGL